MFYPEDTEISMGQQSFADVVSKETISTNSRYQQIVERVGMRIAAVSERNTYQWETKVVASEEQNAFCLPGGKIVVYEGILPICQNEAGLAVVMSHEVAHVLARHGGERMSQTAAVNGMQTAIGYALRNKEKVAQDLWMRAYGVGTNYGFLLPYSRKHESEADHIGLLLMAKAGYDPAEAPRFWTRFASASKGAKPAEFLSTHPAMSDARPILRSCCHRRWRAIGKRRTQSAKGNLSSNAARRETTDPYSRSIHDGWDHRNVIEYLVIVAVWFAAQWAIEHKIASSFLLTVGVLVLAWSKTAFFGLENIQQLLRASKDNMAYHRFMFLMLINMSQIVLAFGFDFHCLHTLDASSFSGINPDETLPEQVFDFVYFSTLNFTFFGYGDITPQTIAAKMLTITEIVLALCNRHLSAFRLHQSEGVDSALEFYPSSVLKPT